MSAPMSPIAPNFKPTQLPYRWGWVVGSGDWAGRKMINSKFNVIQSSESRTICLESRIPCRSSRVPWPLVRVPFPVSRSPCTPLCISKQKELAVYGKYLEELYLIENKNVIPFATNILKKTRGENMKVSPIMLLKTHVEKMSETGHAIICMKTSNIKVARHYIYEKKGS